jgi:hypothetical protein
MHDACFVPSILRALDQVDALKSAAPMLGPPVALDCDAARRERMPRDPRSLEAVTADEAEALQGQGVVISLTDCYREADDGEPINAPKSSILSPFSDVQHVHAVLESIWKARRQISQT